MRVLIENSSQDNEIILDPFMGIGTTVIACINTNRNFIGFEIDKQYYEIANKRIEETKGKNKNNVKRKKLKRRK